MDKAHPRNIAASRRSDTHWNLFLAAFDDATACIRSTRKYSRDGTSDEQTSSILEVYDQGRTNLPRAKNMGRYMSTSKEMDMFRVKRNCRTEPEDSIQGHGWSRSSSYGTERLRDWLVKDWSIFCKVKPCNLAWLGDQSD